MRIAEEIRKRFAYREVDTAFLLENVGIEYPAWVIRFWDGFGVAIPYEGNDVYEEFANAVLYNCKLGLGGQDRKYLLLVSSVEESRNEFATFCRDFVYPGDDGTFRKKITEDPVGWWKRWKILIGNSILEKRPYAVLGELVIYEHLLKEGKSVSWVGPEATSHDIVASNTEYEVKSTLSRYEKIIHISGQFQLQSETGRLFLYFCRFEKNMNGICINDMIDKLVNDYGISWHELDEKLGRLGYGTGNSARKEKYKIHEIIKYLVDKRFPQITPEMFKGEMLPVGIKQLSYDIDLSVVDGQNIRVETGIK